MPKTKLKNLKVRSSEFDFFLSHPLRRYKGRYIAIVGRKVVAAGENAKDVWAKAVRRHPGKMPLLAKVPKEEMLVLIWK